ncbi:MAG: TonB family protein [Acidobacteriota bacterium]|nr:TonB family protein [Acidobacteriota bacterium]
MATQTTTRSFSDPIGPGFAGAFLLHAIAAGLIVSWAWFSHTGRSWGNSSNNAGSIQATMVASLPLPPKATPNPDNVLATETPSPAPVTPKPKAVEVPHPDAIPVPTVMPKTPKVADRTTPAPPVHPQPTKVDPNKAQTGQAASSVAMSSVQNRAGTSSINVQDSAFGSRFAYYVQQLTQKVASQWMTPMLDAQASGHRVYITFQVERDGSLSHVQIAQRSGDATLDQTALSAVQHIDTFPPLPEAYTGNHINVTYYFDPPPRP